MARVSAVLMMAVAAVVLATAVVGQLPGPAEWPQRYVMTQIGYWTYLPGTIAQDTLYYDFPTLRYVLHSTVGVAPDTVEGNLIRGAHIRSFWFNDTLTILQTLPALGNKTNCVRLSMGFGMPRPDWFLSNATRVFETYVGHKWVNDNAYHLAVWTRKYSGGAGHGNGTHFNYLSDNAGQPFSLIAPSPAGEVVNEFYNMTALDSESGFPAGVFDMPQELKCHDVASVANREEFRHALELAGVLRAFGSAAGI